MIYKSSASGLDDIDHRVFDGGNSRGTRAAGLGARLRTPPSGQ